MDRKAVLSILLCTWLTVCLSQSLDQGEEITWDEFVEIVENVPDTEKYEFIRSNYLTGCELSEAEDVGIEELTPELKLALAIFKVLSENLERDVAEDKELLIKRDRICFPLPIGCIDSEDAGIRPT